jgi:murein DD-endopeptidase MepM/ murein hydrolase activator NlpD
MKNKIRRITIKYIKRLKRKLIRSIRLVVIRNKYSRTVRRYAHMDAHKAIKIFARFMHFQIKIRPRIKLVSRVTLALIVAFALSIQFAGYVKAKESEVKINGHAVLVADQANIAKTAQADEQISVSISYKHSPFEFKYPVDGEISQGYSIFHRAYDIAAPFGSPIKPLGSGRVEFAGAVTDGKGNIVIVDHGDGIKTLYAHMSKIEANVGELVTSDSVIGRIGLTGHTTGPHVHLEIYDQGIAINPGDMLPDR